MAPRSSSTRRTPTTPTYGEVLEEYNRKQFMPVFMVEAGYEFEQNSRSPGRPAILRRTGVLDRMLSGATGQLLRQPLHVAVRRGWQDNIDTPGSAQVTCMARLFGSLRWFDLVPDQTHKIVTHGYGTFDPSADVGSSDYVTTAATADGKLAISYIPAGGTITVDMSKLSRPVRGRWYDPTNSTYDHRPGLAVRRAGTCSSRPGKNAAGDPDWVLVLTAQ